MRTAIIQSTGKVILCEGIVRGCPAEILVIAVAYGDDVEVDVSYESDRWLVTVDYYGVTIAHMFADYIIKGSY